MAASLFGMLLSSNAAPLSPAAGAVVKKVATAVITGVSFASLDAGLSSISSKAQGPTPPPAPKPDNNASPDIMVIIVSTTGASVCVVFIILLCISLVKVLNAKNQPTNNE